MASPFNPKAAAWLRGRKSWREQLTAKRKSGARYIWFHCASLGEFEQGRPVMERIAADFPNYKLAISFFSPSGYSIRKDFALADIVCYLPLDTASNARDFLKILQPDLAIFVKYEVWPAFFEAIKEQGVPLIMLSASFRENHRYFKPNARWLLDLLKIPNFIFVQNQDSLRLLEEHQVSNAVLAGDTRFDRVFELQTKAEPVEKVVQFAAGRKLVIFGSCWEQEDETAALLYARLPQDYCLLMVPHDVGSGRVSALMHRFGAACCLYSENDSWVGKQVMVVDSVGLLGRMYQSAAIAVVGGGFRGALHNILEAAAYGLPVGFGARHAKYPEADALLNAGGAFEHADPEGLAAQLVDLMRDDDKMRKMGEHSRRFISSGRGATELVIKTLISNNLLRK